MEEKNYINKFSQPKGLGGRGVRWIAHV